MKVIVCCERCGGESSEFLVSLFNSEVICKECTKKEQSHKEYKRAVKTQLKHLKQGDLSFKGIGLPNDLKPLDKKSCKTKTS